MAEKYFPQPSVMNAQQHFSQIPSAEIERSRFDRSHAYKSTFNAGALIPVFVDECLPGDTFTVTPTAFARLATPLKPIMDNIYLDIQFFFVPWRLVWDNFPFFMGERRDPDDDPAAYSIPQTLLNLSGANELSLASYMGLPYRAGGIFINVMALPFRAYALIWNEWYRDQNLQDSFPLSTGDGPDSNWDQLDPFIRGKRHDYFTSCLPWPQKGDPVSISLTGRIPVRGIGAQAGTGFSSANVAVTETNGVADTYAQAQPLNAGAPSIVIERDPLLTGTPNVYVDLAAATSVTINDLRTAFQIQRLLERDARGGTRYIELVLSHYGVRSADLRPTRPQFLGSSSTRVNINPIASTAPVPDAPQANLAAVGTGVLRGGFSHSFTEHGVVIGIMSARADLTYQQGIERFWSRKTRYDFYWPALSHLGEQAVLNKEIYVQGTPVDDEVFGYQERYAEYRYKPSRVTGLFASEVTSSLDVWHLCQDFSALPVLNSSFIEEAPPIDRIIAVPAEPHFLVDIWFDFKCDRPMPVYSVPGLIDHF